jgi:ribonuclease HI
MDNQRSWVTTVDDYEETLAPSKETIIDLVPDDTSSQNDAVPLTTNGAAKNVDPEEIEAEISDSKSQSLEIELQPQQESTRGKKTDLRSCSINIQMNFDGASKGRLKEAAAGAHLNYQFIMPPVVESSSQNKHESSKTTSIQKYLGIGNTSNQAAFEGVVTGLQQAYEIVDSFKKSHSEGCEDYRVTLLIQGDSKLVMKQLRGECGCGSMKLKPLYSKAQKLLSDFKEIAAVDVQYEEVSRKENERAHGTYSEVAHMHRK